MKNAILIFILALIVVSLNFQFTSSLKAKLDKAIKIPPPQQVKLMTFGYDDSMADMFWLRWLQEPEACGRDKIARSVFENKFQIFKGNDTLVRDDGGGFDRSKREVCAYSWSFLLLDAVTKLAPKWREPYLRGSIFLSVVVDDHVGSDIMFKRSIENFPNEWKFHYQAGYHYLFELDDPDRAAFHLHEAAKLGAPRWTSSLASKLYLKANKAFLGFTVLKTYMEEFLAKGGDKDSEYYKGLEKRLSEIKDRLSEK